LLIYAHIIYTSKSLSPRCTSLEQYAKKAHKRATSSNCILCFKALESFYHHHRRSIVVLCAGRSSAWAHVATNVICKCNVIGSIGCVFSTCVAHLLGWNILDFNYNELYCNSAKPTHVIIFIHIFQVQRLNK
jgi:hypothetical protein